MVGKGERGKGKGPQFRFRLPSAVPKPATRRTPLRRTSYSPPTPFATPTAASTRCWCSATCSGAGCRAGCSNGFGRSWAWRTRFTRSRASIGRWEWRACTAGRNPRRRPRPGRRVAPGAPKCRTTGRAAPRGGASTSWRRVVAERRRGKTLGRGAHDRWGSQRDQDGRAPRGAGPGGGRVAGGRRAHGAGGAGGRDRVGVRGRDVSGGRRHARAQGGGRVGQGRDRGEGQGADRARVAVHA